MLPKFFKVIAFMGCSLGISGFSYAMSTIGQAEGLKGKFFYSAGIGYTGSSGTEGKGTFTINRTGSNTSGSAASKISTSGNVTVNASLGYFLTDNFAIEGSAQPFSGRMNLRHKASQTTGTNTINTQTSKEDAALLIPVTATLQCHFNTPIIKPYLGVGYSYQFIRAPGIRSGGGILGQVGINVPYSEDVAFNLDFKYTHKASHNVELTRSGITLRTSPKLSTYVISAGVMVVL
jgi:outer membrane protein W